MASRERGRVREGGRARTREAGGTGHHPSFGQENNDAWKEVNAARTPRWRWVTAFSFENRTVPVETGSEFHRLAELCSLSTGWKVDGLLPGISLIP